MKYTQKLLSTGISTAFLVSATALPTMAAFEAAGGPLDDLLSNTAAETAQNTTLKAENLSILPGNKKASLMWDPVKREDTSLITKYQISYGQKSVEEGFANTYTSSIKIVINEDEVSTTGIARASVSGLKNGEKYFFVVQAITQDGTLGSKSEEKFTTPSSNTSESTDTMTATASETPTKTSMDALTDGPLEVTEATALTNTIIKVTFSKNVVLPQDIEMLKKLFVVNLKSDEEETLEVLDVIFKENYFLNQAQEIENQVDTGADLYVILKDNIEKETEYQVTASARIKDENGDAISDGISDHVFFSGTDAEEIPATEKEVTPKMAVEKQEEKTSVDPLTALLSATPDTKTADTKKEEENLHSAPNDTTAPEEITNLQAKIIKEVQKFLIKLTWTKSANTAGDLVQQLLYTSIDQGKTWGTPREFTGDINNYSFSGIPEKSYTVKITTKDRSGNESKGVIKTIKVPKLISSGAPSFLAFGLALLGGAAFISRRRKES